MMVFDFEKLTISGDKKSHEFVFLFSDENSAFLNEQKRFMLSLKKDGLKAYTSFVFEQDGVRKHVLGQPETVSYNEIPDDTTGVDVHENRFVGDVADTMWELFNQSEEPVYKFSQTGIVKPTIRITPNKYQNIHFANEIAYILTKKLNEVYDMNISVAGFKEAPTNALIFAQMPWLLKEFRNNPTKSKLRVPSPFASKYYIEYFFTDNIVESINKFFKDQDIKTNKPLRKFVFSNLLIYFHGKHKISQIELRSAVMERYVSDFQTYRYKDEASNTVICYEYNELNLDVLSDLKFLSNILSPDCILEILQYHRENLKSHRSFSIRSSDERNFIDFMSKLSLSKRKRLLKDHIDHAAKAENLLNDTIRQYVAYSNPESIPKTLKQYYPNGLEIPKFQTLKELHDKMSAEYRKIVAEKDNVDIPYSDVELFLDGRVVDGYKIHLPKNGLDIVKWGAQMKHCIASYVQQAAQKNCVLLGLYKDGKCKYNAQISFRDPKNPVKSTISLMDVDSMEHITYYIGQIRGLRNQSAPDSVFKAMEAALDEMLKYGIEITSNESQCEDHQRTNAL